jgi:hypothetical protein
MTREICNSLAMWAIVQRRRRSVMTPLRGAARNSAEGAMRPRAAIAKADHQLLPVGSREQRPETSHLVFAEVRFTGIGHRFLGLWRQQIACVDIGVGDMRYRRNVSAMAAIELCQHFRAERDVGAV